MPPRKQPTKRRRVTTSALSEASVDEVMAQSPQQEIPAPMPAPQTLSISSLAPPCIEQQMKQCVEEIIAAIPPNRVPLEDLIDLKVKLFTGSPDPRSAQEWIQLTERTMALFKFTDQQMVINAVLLLRGQAYQWWQSILNLYPAGKVISWNMFKVEFRKKYHPCTSVTKFTIPKAKATVESYNTFYTDQLILTAQEIVKLVGAASHPDKVPMERLVSLGVEKFTGSPHPEIAQAWFQDTERMLMLLKLSDKEMVENALFLLRGQAYKWSQSILPLYPVSKVISWNLFKREFSIKYCPLMKFDISEKSVDEKFELSSAAQEIFQSLQNLTASRKPYRIRNPLGILVQLGAKTFEGDFDPELAKEWIQDTERLMILIKCTDEQMVKAGVFLLRNVAYYWWKQSLRSGLMSWDISWKEFKTTFAKEYYLREYWDAVVEESYELSCQ